MSFDTEVWPPNLPPETRVRAWIIVPLDNGLFSYKIWAEDTAANWTKAIYGEQNG